MSLSEAVKGREQALFLGFFSSFLTALLWLTGQAELGRTRLHEQVFSGRKHLRNCEFWPRSKGWESWRETFALERRGWCLVLFRCLNKAWEASMGSKQLVCRALISLRSKAGESSSGHRQRGYQVYKWCLHEPSNGKSSLGLH